MSSENLILPDGTPRPCWSPTPGHYYAQSHWTAAEAALYAASGRYPERLLRELRAQAGPVRTAG